jgi:hypothetical protein
MTIFGPTCRESLTRSQEKGTPAQRQFFDLGAKCDEGFCCAFWVDAKAHRA